MYKLVLNDLVVDNLPFEGMDFRKRENYALPSLIEQVLSSIVDLQSTFWKFGLLGCSGIVLVGYLAWPLLNYPGKRKRRKGIMGFRGLHNPGNWCFLNSAVQAISSTKTTVSWIESHEEPTSRSVGRSLKELFDQLRKPSSDAYFEPLSCVDVLNSLVLNHGWSRSCHQQDVHEALILIFDAVIEESRKNAANLNIFDSSLNMDCSNEVPRFAIKRWKSRLSNFPFSSLSVSIMKCLKCNVVRKPNKVEVAHSISMYPAFAQTLPSSHVLNVEDLLKRHFDGELLTDVNCEMCSVSAGVLVNTSQRRSFRILRPPNCLMLHLNRTYWSAFGEPQKLANYVKFPIYLNIFPYMHDYFKIPSFSSNLWYKLCSVIVHLGDSNDFGHYIVYKRVEMKGKEKWICISDENVEFCSAETVLNACFYILIYERIFKSDNKGAKCSKL